MNNENQKLKSSIDRRFDNYQIDPRIPSFGIADIKILIFEFGKDFDKKLEKFVSKEEFKAHADHMDKRFEQMDKRFDQQRAEFLERFEQVDKRFDQQRSEFLERFEHMDKRMDSFATKDFVDAKINHLRSELKEDIHSVEYKLDNKINKMTFATIAILASLMTLFKFFV